jgi:hypothetical protein
LLWEVKCATLGICHIKGHGAHCKAPSSLYYFFRFLLLEIRVLVTRFRMILMQKIIRSKNKFIHSSVPFCMINKKFSIWSDPILYSLIWIGFWIFKLNFFFLNIYIIKNNIKQLCFFVLTFPFAENRGCSLFGLDW